MVIQVRPSPGDTNHMPPPVPTSPSRHVQRDPDHFALNFTQLHLPRLVTGHDDHPYSGRVRLLLPADSSATNRS